MSEPAQPSGGEGDVNTLRILVATDCHLGYMEKDEIRRFDSFQAFEEICALADKNKVDFILLGGDLFHENKPSRSTLVKTIEILRRYCLNDQPVKFQVVSDQTVNFPNRFGKVNYEDPNFNVGLPVFTIHGNHDDPAGVDNLSAIDILSACNLVNYFGKMDLGGSGVGQIAVYPVLVKKGMTSVALYGLGNIRDERLNRMFQTPHSVQWMRPGTQDGESASDWFNILVLHQNRIKTNPKSAINEHFLPRFLDFIVWGHEHECLIDPQEVPGMGFHITQPGSSVATSLIDGEAKPKHVLLLEIKGNQYRPTKIPLRSVRPFEYAEVVLKDEADVNSNDQDSVLEHLDKIVRNLIEKSSQPTASRSEPKLPLVRIKVDYSGFSTINPQRFGQKYVGKVANPQDILIFSKSAKRRQTTGDHIDDSEKLRPEELNQQTIEALVAESNLKMEILPVDDLDIALHDFVNKDDKMAFYSCLQRNLEETRNKLSSEADKSKFEEEDIIVKVGECMQERVKERSLHSKDGTRLTTGSHNLDTGGKSFTAQSNQNSFSDDEDTREMLLGARSTDVGRKSSGFTRPSKDTADVAKRGTSKRGRGRGTSSMKQTTLSFSQSRSATVIRSEDVASSEEEADANEVVENSEEESAQQVGRKRAAPRGRGRGRGGGSTAKRGRKTDIASMQNMMSKDDDDSEDEPPKKTPRVTRNYGAVRRR
uniref:Double-strand break repair protein n=2 Tax=Zea mays TaxID=4577 RepID=A0A1P8W044_ZEAMP|nr:double strand break repair nuclease MRE11A [Zea mays subsp. mays]APZ84320.1 double strand break repair nuclease MRE11A [Zea mays subsp. parviglumis]APZ84328.1 double strand break repair nuclease MRE11A [Zea mays subsp. parviglumis]